MNPADLESMVHRKLARLPAPRAPETLLPRVMAEIHRSRQTPGYGHPRVQWSPLRLVGSLLALVALLWVGDLVLERGAGGVLSSVSDRIFTGFGEMAAGTEAMVRDARLLWRVFLEPIAGYFILWIGSMWVVCALLCEALTRVLRERSVSQ